MNFHDNVAALKKNHVGKKGNKVKKVKKKKMPIAKYEVIFQNLKSVITGDKVSTIGIIMINYNFKIFINII